MRSMLFLDKALHFFTSFISGFTSRSQHASNTHWSKSKQRKVFITTVPKNNHMHINLPGLLK